MVKRLRTDQSSMSSAAQVDRLPSLPNVVSTISVTADVHAVSDVPAGFKDSESLLGS